jgi:hypothetical protein
VWLVQSYLFDGEQLQVIHWAFIVPIVAGIGAFGAWASLDFEFGTAAIHCSLYLLVTTALALILGVKLF